MSSSQTQAWHVITCEYPPQLGGVSDYTRLLAEGMTRAGDEVHVWCPSGAGVAKDDGGPVVHPVMGQFRPGDLRLTGRMLDSHPGPRRLLVQWVPHGYGCRAMNLPFCFWLVWRSVRHGDEISLMAHESFLSFGEGGWRHNVVAAVQRLMTMVILQAVRRVWVSTPRWINRLRPLALGRTVEFEWLPVPSNVPVTTDHEGVRRVLRRYAPEGQPIIGHFGTHNPLVVSLLKDWAEEWFRADRKCTLLLIGPGGEPARKELIRMQPGLASAIHATGPMPHREISDHLAACDLMLQPYSDGVSARRGAVMAALAHQRPVLTTEGPFTEPEWRLSNAVGLVPVNDPAALAEATHRLLLEASERSWLAAAGHRLYSELFDIRHTVSKVRGQTEEMNLRQAVNNSIA